MEENALVEEREELMMPSNGSETPNLKKAHFLKPTLDPKNQTLLKPPPLFLSPKPMIKLVDFWVKFRGRPQPQKNWDIWVGNLQQTHKAIWEKVGIFDAIRASTYKIWWDNELIIKLSENWCPDTNTFIFPWGESTITLEDIMILGGFPVLGACVKTPFQSREFEENDNILVNILPEIRKSSRGVATQNEWMNYFMGIGGELEHIAFLVLWLSRFVFTTNYYSEISPSVYPIAIALARGIKIALAPAVLASIYRDLSLLKRKFVGLVNASRDLSSKLFLFAPFQLVQLWAWERFPTLSPKPITLLRGEPRLARWQNLRKAKIKSAMVDFESLGESFLWRPYALFHENWQFPEFYVDEERLVLMNSEVGGELLSFARCLRHCELVGLDCIEQYSPQRVGRQFGLDQDIPRYIHRCDDTAKLAWSSYDIPLDGVKLFLSPRLLKGDVTARYFDCFKRASCLANTSALECKKRKSPRNLPGGARFELSKSVDGVVINNSNCTSISSLNVPLVSGSVDNVGEMRIAAAVSSDRDNNLDKSHVDDVMQIPSLEIAISNAVSGMDSLIGKLERSRDECVDVRSNTMVDGVVAEMHNETVPSCDKSINPRAINEVSSSMDSPMVGNSRMDSLIEKLGKCREICVNISSYSRVDSIAEMHDEAVPSCDKSINPSRSQDNCFQVLPSQSTQIVVANEVANLMNSEGARLGDEALTAENEDAREVECSMGPDNRKKICRVTSNDKEGKESEFVNVKLEGSVDDTVIIIDDDEDDRNEGDHNPFAERDADLEARVCKLERIISWLQAAKSGSKAR